MAEEKSAFDKIHIDERDKADLGGVLEQLNLPPSAVDFVRKYQKIIYLVLALIATVVIVWSLYGSYADKRLEKSSSAFATAMNLDGEERVTALNNVVDEYSGTDPAMWAKIELARHSQEKGAYDYALEGYLDLRASVKDSNPVIALLTFGIAQAYEALENFDKALEEYETLKNTSGYENIGYSGIARIYEIQGKFEEAVNTYEQYLGVLGTDPAGSGEKAYISEKLTRLKASM